MWKVTKKCPKCNGNMIIERDEYGKYIKCLQCGHQLELKATNATQQTPAKAKQPVELFNENNGYKLSET